MRRFASLCIAMCAVCPLCRAGEITTAELVEAFTTYIQKAEHVTPDKAKLAKVRKELEAAKADPLFRPFVFAEKEIGRAQLMAGIEKGLEACKAAGFPLSRTSEFAAEKANLEKLSDAELVMAFRLVDQVAGRLRQQD